MDRQNIDRLFREKLDQLEVAPSASSWSKVEKQLDSKKSSMIYWVAASITLILSVWIMWPARQDSDELTPIASEVSYPKPTQIPGFVLPDIKIEKQHEVDQAPKTIKKPISTNPPVQLAIHSTKERGSQEKERPHVTELDKRTVMAEVPIEKQEILNEAMEKVNKPTLGTVKITYIASSKSLLKESHKGDSTGVIKKFIAFAENIDPGDVLAEIKAAKDQLIAGGFKSKKDKNSL